MNNKDAYDLLRSKPSLRAATDELLDTFQQPKSEFNVFSEICANLNPVGRALLKRVIWAPGKIRYFTLVNIAYFVLNLILASIEDLMIEYVIQGRSQVGETGD